MVGRNPNLGVRAGIRPLAPLNSGILSIFVRYCYYFTTIEMLNLQNCVPPDLNVQVAE